MYAGVPCSLIGGLFYSKLLIYGANLIDTTIIGIFGLFL